MERGHPLGTIASLWRYPVKSLAAEALEVARVGSDGFENDRHSALFISSGHARTGLPLRGKEHNLLHTVRDETAAVALAEHAGIAVERRDGGPYFDSGPVSVLFDVWLAEAEALTGMRLDPLRYRPNIFARAAEPIGREGGLTGMQLRAGSVVFRVLKPIVRCVTTTYDIESGESSPDVLRAVAQHRDAQMGIYCAVETPGSIAAGDRIERLK